MRTTFTFLADPGHAWLIVSPADICDLGLSEASFSTCSYQFGDNIGLEEDCDATTFLNAYRAKHGDFPELLEDQGSCRHWAPYGRKA